MSKKSFQVSIDFLGNISDLQNKIKTLSGDLSKIGATSGGVNVQKQFDQLTQSIQNLQTKAKQPITSQGEFNKLMQEVNKVEGSYNNLINTLDGLYSLSNSKKLELLPKDEQQRIKQAAQAIKVFEANTKSASSSIKELRNAQDKANNALDNQAAAQKTFKSLTTQAAAAEKEYNNLATAANNLADAQEKYNNLFYKTGKRAGQQKDNVSNEQVAEATAKLAEAKAKADMLKGAYDNIGTAAAEAGKRAQTLSNLKIKADEELTKSKEAANRLGKELEDLKTKFEASSGQQLQQSFEQLKNKAKELGVSLEGIGDKATTSGIDLLKQRLQSLETQGLQKVDQGIVKTIATTQDGLLPALQNIRLEADKSRDSFDGFARAMNDVEGLKSRIGYFFSMTNSVMLLRRALTSALNTVKELDAVMTETAVVTDFSVGDMWEKLPEYASHANALGASIKDLYSATTLYYQQGLQTEAAIGVGIETMKMARIAGMDAANATEAMTAALRGFNMEVNETNAVRVNDVYSELAAITAADTEQIATAMSKTASIASAANMEFETTAALLAQIIETTQEAPETAGTALKTIIARFSEVKKLREEGQTTGEDEEGEAIDVNKIQGALRTVGISMDDFFAGTEGLDSILLKLAEKWKDLDFETQRYIATTAAGSRQQSRFIAMMSDYERTMELATAANNSAGASQRQFDKTLESMEAKLQKLKNAWNEFTMGLANNEILKFGVSALTTLINAINKVVNGLSGGNGLVKSILNLGIALTGLKAGGAVLSGIFTSIGSVKAGEGIKFAQNLKNSFSKTFANWKITPQIDFKAEGIKAYQTSLASLQQSFTTVKIAQIAAEEEMLDYGSSCMYNTALVEAQNAANTQLAATSAQLAAATGLENQIAEQATLINAQGIPLKYALKAAQKGETIETLKAAAAKTLNKEATKELTEEELKAYVIKAFGWRMTIADTWAKIKNAAATAAQVTVQKMLNIEMAVGAGLMLTALGIVLALAAAIGILVAAIVLAIKSSPENMLKKATKSAEQAAEAADAAAESYDNLNSSLESIEEKESILKDLAVGTLEWKEAVADLNGEILDLISKYPELAEFVQTSNMGVMSLTDAEINGKTVESVMADYQQKIASTQAAKAAANIEVQRAQQDVYYANLDDYAKTSNLISGTQKQAMTADTPAAAAGMILGNMIAEKLSNRDLDESYDEQATRELAISIAKGESTTENTKMAAEDPERYRQLKSFGDELIASEAAIDVFTNSLMSAAITNAEIAEENKDQFGGMYDTEAIDAMIVDQEIDPNDTFTREQYATAMGYQYENGKFYTGEGENKKEVTVLDQDIKSQLAAIRVQNKLTENVELMAGKMGELAKNGGKLGEAFVSIASKANGAGLTLDDLKNLEGQLNVDTDENGKIAAWSQAMADLYDQVGQFYPSREEFYRVVSEATKEANLQKTTSQKKLTHMGMEEIFQNTKIDTGALASITDSLYDVFLASGPDVAQALAGSIEETLSTIENPEQVQIFADALNAIDWQNLDSVEELETVLEGMDFDYAVDGLDELKQEIITAAKATKTFNLDAIKEQVKSIEDLIEDVEDREDTERKFTQEEYDTITKASPELASQFVATGLDEFVYVGDSMQSLIEALNQNTAALLGDYGEQVRANAAISEKWLGIEDQRFNSEYSAMELITSVIGGSIDASLYDVRENGTRSQGAMDLINLMEQLGLGADSGRDLNSNVYSGEDLVRILTEGYNQYYGDFGTIAQQNVDSAEAYTQKEETVRLSKMEGTEILNDNQATEESKQAVLDAKIALEGLQEEYDKTTKSLKAQDSALASNEKLIKASIVDAKNYEDKLAGLAEAYDDNKDALADTNKGTREYQKALSDITKAAKEAFGNDITEDFVENNLDLFEDWYKGAEGSADRLRSALINSLIEASNETEVKVGQIRDIVSHLDGLNFDIYGHADASQLFAELAAVMGSAQAAAEAMEVLGYSVTWEPNGVTYMMVPDPDNPTRPRAIEIPNYKAVVTDGLGNRAGANRSSYGGGSGGGGGGGGGGGSKTKWENPYDEFYNTVELLNEELRKREQLERRYQRLLDKTGTKASDLVSNTKQQLDSLEFELKTRQNLLAGRERQMAEIEAKNSKYSKYAWYNEEKQVIEIDWNKMQALDGSTNEDFTQGLEDYVSKLEEQQGLIEDELDAIYDIEDAIWEIYDQGKDEYFDLEEQIKEALQSTRQKEIDTLSEINDSINDTNSRLIDAMQSSIDKYRQDRENEKTEEELSDKQRRLAYLQQDTSGANALEIMQLQKEIEEGQEDYTDTLIDQKISELQEQNDEAAEQRQHQIDLLQAQLDHYLESQQVWDDIYSLMNTGIGPDGIVAGSELENLLKESANFEGMSYLQKMEWLSELEDNVAKAVQWLMSGNSTEALIAKGELKSGETIKFTTADGEIVEGVLDEEGNVTTSTGEKYTDVYRTYNGALVTSENFITPKPVEPEPKEPEEPKQTFTPPALTDKIKRGVAKAIINGNYGWGVGRERVNKLNEVFGANDIQRNYVNKGIYGGNAAEYSYTSMRRKFKQYKTGGLADFTGPAWLDGTKSKPEYILNADQTKAFFSLVNVLEGLSAGTSHNAQISGDSIYDIDINVESISNDYDVEQMASTIKRMINDDARYRNNNAINLSR